ncbi:MAG: hypothetical protein QXL96_11545 [Ignisphaera sp.]
MEVENRKLILKLHRGREIKLKLSTSSKRVKKFRDWNKYELAIRVNEDKIYIAIYFRKTVKLKKTRTVTAIDVNFDNITLGYLHI